MTGQTISHYLVMEKLGQGGMGIVYKAEDTRLKRTVALKFLPAAAVSDPDQRARFEQEAQAAAALDHPNICAIFEIDDFRGQPFIAMAFVDGQNLKAKIQSGPLNIQDALDLAGQIGQGLQEAHEKGIVHRDIKSANIMVTPRGQAKIMDFGLAQLSGQTRITRTGIALGTPAYMSPEQAEGGNVDYRTDIWSLGVVLFEMLTGQLPFKGGSEFAVVHSILTAAPEPLANLRPGLPPGVERLVARVLAKRPGDRYQRAGELLSDLRALQREPAGHFSTPSSIAITPERMAMSIAVLPFANLNRDEESEFFADGITDELISALSKIDRLRVVSRTSAFQFKGKTQDAREIGEKLRVGFLLEGSVRRAGNRIRVTAQLVNIADGYDLWSERYDREMKDVFDIQDEISHAIVEALKVKLVGGQPERMIRRHTENLDAYNQYLRGMYSLNRWSFPTAIECFERAAALDPAYALPYAGIAVAAAFVALWGLGDPKELWPKARAAAQKALELDPSLPEAHSALGVVMALHEHNWREAREHLERAIELNPGDALTHYWYAMNYLGATGRLEEAKKEIRAARELDPLSLLIAAGAAWIHVFTREFDRAIELARRVVEIDSTYAEAYLILAVAQTAKSSFGEAIASTERALEITGGAPAALGVSGWVYALAGKTAEAEKRISQLTELAKQRPVSTYMDWILIGLGRKEEALASLERGYAESDPHVAFLKVLLHYDSVRADPRFQALLHKMGLAD